MREEPFKPETMPIFSLDTSGTSRHEAFRFLHGPELKTAYIAESIKAGDKALFHALSEVERAAYPSLKDDEALL